MPLHSYRNPALARRPRFLIPAAFFMILAQAAHAGSAAFDLTGPHLEATVSRSGKTLPISEVANLQAGDRLWIHPDFPDTQSVHYLMIVAFLRGSTNPPPEEWFTRAETWTKKVREEGIVVTVPKGAQQALIFLAPETGGDFSTLRGAVRARPGVFVRASQDLNQASLDRARLDKYLDDIKQTSSADPMELHERSETLAHTLSIKVDQQCFDKPTEQQAPCLTQNTDQLVLDDGHTQSMVDALTSGPSSDLIGAVSTTPLVHGGYFSPYVGSVVDLARLLGTLHTAEYQYIPALVLPRGDQIHLRLNSPPSFANPKSVLVIGLPAVEAAQLPPLRAVNSDEVFCAQKTPLLLPVEGAPLVFSTSIAHDFVLHFSTKSGKAFDLPASPDAARGGFVVDARALPAGALVSQVKGTLRGYWGFGAFEGPSFNLRGAHEVKWAVTATDQDALVIGREDTIHLSGDCAACVESVVLHDARGKDVAVTSKAVKPDELEVKVPLKDEPSGRVTLKVKQFGLPHTDDISLLAYSEAAHLDNFTINTGDNQAVLTGTRLDQVESVKLDGMKFVPGKLSREDQKDELPLLASNDPSPSASSMTPDEKLVAYVALKDGRILDMQTTVEPPRPKVTLFGKTVDPGPTPSAIRLGSPELLPQDGRLSFFLKSEVPEKFSRTEKIEVGTEDGSSNVMLTVADGSLILQDEQTILAVLDPLKSFGPSAFGPLRFRPVSPHGKGNWEPLARLVRIPSLKEVHCPDEPDKPCTLLGTNLFLIDSVASDAAFTHTVPVPLGFVSGTLTVPRPNGTLLYLKLRDDPSTVNTVVLPVLPEQ